MNILQGIDKHILKFLKSFELNEFLQPFLGRLFWLISYQNGFDYLQWIKHLVLVGIVKDFTPFEVLIIKHQYTIIEFWICY